MRSHARHRPGQQADEVFSWIGFIVSAIPAMAALGGLIWFIWLHV